MTCQIKIPQRKIRRPGTNIYETLAPFTQRVLDIL